jgi:hypothetical protein
MNRKLKNELKRIIFSTLDFCGNTHDATREFCIENNLYHNDDIEMERFKIVQEYHQKKGQK